MLHLSLKVRLTLFITFILGLSLLIYSIFLYQSVAQVYQDELDVFLYNYAYEVSDAINFDILGKITIDRAQLTEETKVFPFLLSEVLLQVRMRNGSPIVKSKNLGPIDLPFDRNDLGRLKNKNFIIHAWETENPIRKHTNYRIIDYPVNRDGGAQFILQVAVPDRLVVAKSRKLRNLFFFTVPLILIFSAFLGYYFSTLALMPVQRIISTARKIHHAKHLSERIETPKNEDELKTLVLTLNELFDRLEKAFIGQEKFVADASHQLKTPLTIIKAEIENLKKEYQAQDNTKGINPRIESIGEEVDFLAKLVNDLLILAKIEAGENILEADEVRLDELVISSAEKFKGIVNDKSISVTFNFIGNMEEESENNFSVRGDAGLLKSLFQNLLENSIKYSEYKGRVEVSLQNKEHFVEISIRDFGPGIEPSELPKVFNRFYRGKNAKESTYGSGLGLSIAKRIADIHEAELSVANHQEGGFIASFKIKNI